MSALNFATLQFVRVGIAHSYLGERYMLEPFGGTEFTTKTLRFAWHVTSIGRWGSAALLVLLARVTPRGRIGLLAVGALRVRAAAGGI